MSRVLVSDRLRRLTVLPTTARVLEVGCGAGFNAVEQLRRFPSWRLTALDLDADMLGRTRSRLGEDGLGAALVRGSALELPFRDGAFDVVLCLGILHHVGDWRQALHELRRVARSGGQVVVADLLAGFFVGSVRTWYPPVETYTLWDIEAALPGAGLEPVASRAGRLGYLLAARAVDPAPPPGARASDAPIRARLTRGPVPAPWALPWVRLASYRRNPATFLASLQRVGGDAVRFRLGWYRVTMVSDPALIRRVLVTDAARFHKGLGGQQGRRLLGNGVITSEGEYHRRQRALLRPLIDPRTLAPFAPEIVELTDTMLSSWKSGVPLDVSAAMANLTVQIIGRVALGADVGTATGMIAETMRESAETFTRLTTPWGRLLEPLPLPGARAFRRSRSRLYDYVDQLIEARRRSSPTGGRRDLLSLLLTATDDTGGALSAVQIRDEVVTMILAGHETTAQLLSWALYLLAVNPAAADRLHGEVLREVGGKPPTYGDLPHLTYARHVVYEALRLYPPVYSIGRQAIRDVDLAGWRLRAGELVVVSPWVVHRDPRWFDEPERFLPERWEAPGVGSGFRFLPFGGGERACLGQPLVAIEAPLVLARMAQRFAVEPPAGAAAPTIDPRVSLRPASPIRLVPRERVP